MTKHVHVPAGSRSGHLVGRDWLNVAVETGVDTTETITVTGIALGDTVIAVTDLTTPGALVPSEFEVTAADTITYSGETDYGLMELQIFWLKNQQ